MTLVLIGTVATAIAAGVAVDAVARFAWRIQVRRRSRSRLDGMDVSARESVPLWVAILRDGGGGASGRAMGLWIAIVGRILDQWMFRRESYEPLVRRAGLVAAIDRVTFEAASARWALVGATAGALAGWMVGAAIPGAVVAGAAAGVAPTLLLRKAARMRSEGISAELPAMIDLVSLGLEAGLSLERSLDLYAKRRPGALADELQESERTARLTVMRREKALGQVATRSGSEPFVQFASVVSQSIRLGTPLVAILDTEAARARASHRSLIEARIARAPIRMVVPLGVFILPAMILIVVGPMAATFVGG